MDSPPTVAVVIVTWNRRNDLLELLASLKGQTYPAVQVIVVDNGSTDDTVRTITTIHPDVQLIPLQSNFGACHGRNVGTREVNCDLALYLDDDITLEPRCIEEIVAPFGRNESIGAVQSTVIDPWSNLDPPGDPTLRFCPHPREGSYAIRMDSLPPDPWPAHFNRQGEGPWVTLHLYERGLHSVFWPPAKTHHHSSPGGQREKVLFFFTRNSLLTFYQRMPLLVMPPLVIYKAFRPLLNVRSGRDFLNWIGAVSNGFRLILMGKAPRQPVSWKACRRYFDAVRKNLKPWEPL